MVLSNGRIVCIKRYVTQGNHRNKPAVYKFRAEGPFIFLGDAAYIEQAKAMGR